MSFFEKFEDVKFSEKIQTLRTNGGNSVRLFQFWFVFLFVNLRRRCSYSHIVIASDGFLFASSPHLG